MDITADTRIGDLIKAYPDALEFLAAYDPHFEKLRNPLLRATVGKAATLRIASEMAGVPLDDLLSDLRAEFGDREAQDPAVERAARQEELKAIIRELHAGASVEAMQQRFAEVTQGVGADEIAAMEQALIAEGMPVSEVQRLCDVHVQVFRSALDEQVEREVPEGHPIDSYRKENAALAGVIEDVRCELEALKAAPSADERQSAMRGLDKALERLADIDIHYTRKENQLFPLLEKHGITGPTQVMWGIHDDIRSRVKAGRQAAAQSSARVLSAHLPETLKLIEDMIYKEEKILFQVSLDTLSDEEFEEMAAGEGAIGYAWIDTPPPMAPRQDDVESAGAAAEEIPPDEAAREEGRPHVAATAAESPVVEPAESAGEPAAAPDGLLTLTTGALTPEQVDLLLQHLPLDITFVDETGRVRYYSEGDRIFPRSPGVIGREVRNCHPPKSVDVVERIVEEFRRGNRSTAAFWIELMGRLVFIRYFAVRDQAGEYRGVLEVTQDVTDVRELQGERRLLDW